MAASKQKKTAGRPLGRVIQKHVTVDLHPLYPTAEGLPKTWALFRNGIPAAFQVITGLPAALLRKDHRDAIDKLMSGEYPKLRKSAARLFIEGTLTDGDPPLRNIPTGGARRLEAALTFLDMLETMVYVTGFERLLELDLLAVPKTKYSYRPMVGGRRMTAKEALDQRRPELDKKKAMAAEARARARAEGQPAEEVPAGTPLEDGLDEFISQFSGGEESVPELAEAERLASELENE